MRFPIAFALSSFLLLAFYTCTTSVSLAEPGAEDELSNASLSSKGAKEPATDSREQKSSQLRSSEQPQEATSNDASSNPPPHPANTQAKPIGYGSSANSSKAQSQGPFFSGNLELRYRGRFRGGSQDNDLYQYLRGDIHNLWKDKVTVSGFGRVYEDLDGREAKSDVFRNILDTYSNRINGRLYYLFADVRNPIGDDSLLRLGRQHLYGAEDILFDGAKYEQNLDRLEYYLFGGARASYYRDTHLDRVAGAGAAFRPGRYTKVGVDYAVIEDDEFSDNFYSLSVWQTFTRDLSFFGRYSYLNTQPRDLTLKLSWNYQPWDVSLQGTYFRFFNTLDASDELTNNFDPYIALIDSYSPFQNYKITVYKGLGKYIMLSGGLDYRELLRDNDENAFNREFKRYFANLILHNFLWSGLETSTGIEYWSADKSDRNVDVTFEVTQRIGKKGEVSFGTNYNRYVFQFDKNFLFPLELDDENERIDSRVFFIRAKWRLTNSSYFSTDYQLETTNIDSRAFHTLTFTYGIDF